MRTAFYLLMAFCSHYSGTTVTALSRSSSLTNIDSNYVAITAHVGTISDSLGDSLFVPIQAIALPLGTSPASADIGIQNADTLMDSILIYMNHSLIYRQKVSKLSGVTSTNGKGSADVYFGLQFGPNSNAGIPDQLEFIPKMKVKAGKGAHTIRFNFNYIQQ